MAGREQRQGASCGIAGLGVAPLPEKGLPKGAPRPCVLGVEFEGLLEAGAGAVQVALVL
jgi:hypothetical protein